jgi:hypothetical protein
MEILPYIGGFCPGCFAGTRSRHGQISNAEQPWRVSDLLAKIGCLWLWLIL